MRIRKTVYFEKSECAVLNTADRSASALDARLLCVVADTDGFNLSEVLQLRSRTVDRIAAAFKAIAGEGASKRATSSVQVGPHEANVVGRVVSYAKVAKDCTTALRILDGAVARLQS